MTNKRKYIILLAFAIVIFVAILILRNSLIKKEQQNKQYNSLDDFTTPKEVIEYTGGEYIKEVKSPVEDFNLDIYAKFSVDLYTSENSNEEYYRKMVRIMAYVLKFENFRIVDEEKQILIAVICNKEESSISRTFINGDDQYFATQNSKIELSKMQDVKITKLDIESNELKQLIKNNWNKNTLNTNEWKEFNKYLYLENKIALRNVYKKVFNIVFKSGYTDNVLNGINTSMKLDEIIKILGEPTFGSIDKGLIGYKGTEIYAFFSSGTISIYRIDKYQTDELINILEKFQEERDVKKFVSSITNMWQDYDLYNYDTKFVNLIYSLKGIKVQFNMNSSHGLIVGNNYKGNIKELMELKEKLGMQEIYFENTDFVYETELTRLNSIKG